MGETLLFNRFIPDARYVPYLGHAFPASRMHLERKKKETGHKYKLRIC